MPAYAAKKWLPFGAAEALFQELRARRENQLKLLLLLVLELELVLELGAITSLC